MEMPLYFFQTVFVQSVEPHSCPTHLDRNPSTMNEFFQAATHHIHLRGAISRVTPPLDDAIQGILGVWMFHEMLEDVADGLFHLAGRHLIRHASPRFTLDWKL